mmetsp:Transcript_3950/g.4600  ORF Transcript_3950/g.4600 Transcript_3950/m.4600 type:complete len:237 (+) Transcript_3950:165-875(+)|eukprot:CAMPEP_0204836338 /NCGR_PEP_ID=MMETSP1346-20131115/24848_1 /ASSEMBLY_ACC=CAM_ASM_000771 /TAXON_ID=215587 /ORGANISM="Aplanochytrium stocchinoi, Strain GSBS06" /LENGTH=236 /DNA_ID=CAMNT_0051970955 /DNA_START=86 /DNA_END=796 /DNA_ORIENTATION=-
MTSSESLVHRAAIFSKRPQKLKAFYEALGVRFIEISFKFQTPFSRHIISTNSGIVVIPTGSCSQDSSSVNIEGTLAGILAYRQCKNKSNEHGFSSDAKVDARSKLAWIVFDVPYLNLVPVLTIKEQSVFTVLRTDSIEDLKMFYKNQGVGPWVLEKHGTGPEHFALEKDGHVIELYPFRKTNKSSSEVIVVIKNNFKGLLDRISKTEEYEVVSSRKTAFLVRDPEGRLFNIMNDSP